MNRMIPLCLLAAACGNDYYLTPGPEVETVYVTNTVTETVMIEDTDEPCTPVEWFRDADYDRHSGNQETQFSCDAPGDDWITNPPSDCDDNDPDTFPGAQEVAFDERDQNCNGILDDCGVREIRMYDLDEDGYGDETGGWIEVDVCNAWLPNMTEWHPANDCNDADPTIHPVALEVCDGVDNNCNDFVDEQFFYSDTDLDGYGDDSRYVISEGPCVELEELVFTDWVPVAGDCDDADPSIYPGNGC